MPLKIIFAGTSDFGIPCLEALLHSTHQMTAVYTQPDRPAGRGKKLKQSPIKTFALEHSLKIFQPEILKSLATCADKEDKKGCPGTDGQLQGRRTYPFLQ